MNNNFQRKNSHHLIFYYLNAAGNWAHLTEKSSQPGAEIT